ncbi:hypothetical protein [Gordonia sp. (in: high G+C Gram-positive bacteria)]|uniref:hypothetical protein n=1 Tax=Gordonia sp. (in: high G+C Gram-positive bacteria) TaxID=84139 RepID=UPI003C72D820
MMLLAFANLPASVSEPLEMLLGYVMWFICLAAVARLLWIGGEMGWARRTGEDFAETPAFVFVGLIVASAASGIAGALLSF